MHLSIEIQEILFGFLGFLGGILAKGLLDSVSHRRLFDHRLRIEKEYELYGKLWDKLFELRRVVGQFVSPLGNSDDEKNRDELIDLFNAYQTCLRKGEPFMTLKVYQPARKITMLVRNILGNKVEIEKLETQRSGRISIEKDEDIARQVELAEKSDEAFNEIERLFIETQQEIRRRVSPT